MVNTIADNEARVQRIAARLAGLKPEELMQIERGFERRDVLMKDRVVGRDQSRVNRIVDALDSLEKRIASDPEHPKIELLENRASQYRESLVNFAKYKQETPPTGNKPGVILEVPLGRFGLAREQ